MNTDSIASTGRKDMSIWRRSKLLALISSLAMVLMLVAGCSSSTTGTTTGSTSNPVAPAQYGGAYNGGVATGDTQEGAQFAQWVLNQDPQHQYITDAVVRNDQTLGVKVNPTATKADVQKLLVSLASGMARTFPNRPLKVEAFFQSGDKLAEANYDPTTNQVSVAFNQ